MEIKEIKKWLESKGVDKHMRIERENGNQYLFNLLKEFNDVVRLEVKQNIIKKLERFDFTD